MNSVLAVQIIIVICLEIKNIVSFPSSDELNLIIMNPSASARRNNDQKISWDAALVEEKEGRRVTVMRDDGVEMSCLLPNKDGEVGKEVKKDLVSKSNQENGGSPQRQVSSILQMLNGMCFLRLEGQFRSL